MAIKKQFIKTKPVCKVTFSLEAKEANAAAVVGDFNNWNPSEGELSKLKNGTFKAAFDLPNDNSFEFRYIVDGSSQTNHKQIAIVRMNSQMLKAAF
jgi:1,4-alpha-glucan branching enzyme